MIEKTNGFATVLGLWRQKDWENHWFSECKI